MDAHCSHVNCRRSKAFALCSVSSPFCWLIQFAINPGLCLESFYCTVIFISGQYSTNRETIYFAVPMIPLCCFVCLTIVFLFSFLFTRLTVRRHFIFYVCCCSEAIWIYHINDFEEYPRKKICSSVPEREVRDF